nr:hypothetical conserved protein [uncultured Gammaproteobacteria bacterium]
MRKLSAVFPLLVLVWSASATAHGPVRQKVEEKVTINAPAEKVWETVKEFCSIKQWHPKVSDCTAEGASNKKYKLTLSGGGWVVEELKGRNDAKMAYSYKFNVDDMSAAKTIVHASQEIQVPVLPVANFSGSLEVKKQSDKAVVIWKGAFYRAYMNNNPPPEMNEEAAIRAITDFFRSGLDNLKQLLEKP